MISQGTTGLADLIKNGTRRTAQSNIGLGQSTLKFYKGDLNNRVLVATVNIPIGVRNIINNIANYQIAIDSEEPKTGKVLVDVSEDEAISSVDFIDDYYYRGRLYRTFTVGTFTDIGVFEDNKMFTISKLNNLKKDDLLSVYTLEFKVRDLTIGN